jgi:hypothetical protein
MPTCVTRIVSGGQTGADRGALDAAISLGIPHGGWCPLGRLAEDGAIPDCYQLSETDSTNYRVRTEQNVIDSDATLIFFRQSLYGGTELTRRLASQHAKPYLLVNTREPADVRSIREWLNRERIGVLNVAGPRESSAPGIQQEVDALLRAVLGDSSGASR